MSDNEIWEKPQQQLDSSFKAPSFKGSPGTDWKSIEDKTIQRNTEREANIEKWGFNIPDEQYMALNDAVANEKITIDEGYKLAASFALSKQYDMPPEYFRENFDQVLKALHGPAEGHRFGSTAFNFVVNKGRAGVKNMEMGNLRNQLREAELTGNKEHANNIKKSLENYEKEIYHNSDPDEKDRNFFMRALGTAAESAPYTAYVAASYFFGSLLAPGVGTAAAFMAGMEVTRGHEYHALREAGASINTANNVSLISSSIQSAIEAFLGNALSIAGGAAKAVGKKALTENVTRTLIEKATANAFKNAHGSGLFLKTALHVGGGYVGEMFEEGLEELLQEFTSAMALEVANAMQEGGVETYTAKEILENMGEAFKGGAMASIFLGIPGTGLNARASIKSWQQVKTEAEYSKSENEFIERTKDSQIFEGMSDEKRLEYQKQVFTETQKQVKAEENARARELKNKRLYGAMDPSGDVFRENGNGLYMEHSRHTESNGITTGEFAAGDPHKSEKNSYAIGNYELRGDKVNITEFRIGQKYEGLQDEILQNFADDIGKEIEYNGQRYAPISEGRSLRFGWGDEKPDAGTSKTEAKAYRFDFDRQPYTAADTQADTNAKKNFAGQIRSLDTKISSDIEVDTVVDFYDTVGRKWFGMGFDSFMSRMTGGKKEGWVHQELSDTQIARWFANNQGVLTDAAAILKIQENLTDTQREEARASIHGFAVTGADGVTKAIYAARDADFSTFIHEGVHAFTKLAEAVDPALYRGMMEAAGLDMDEYSRSDAAGKEQMTRQAMEKLAYGAEAYLKEGPASLQTPALQNLYMKIKEFLKDLADAIEKGKFLSPEVRSLFDGLFGEEADTDGTGTDKTAQTGIGKSADDAGAVAGYVNKTKPNINDHSDDISASEELEIYSEDLKRKIKDKSLPIEERSKAAVQNAELEMLDEQDRDHAPTAELVKRARRIADPALQMKVIHEIRDLRQRYAGTKAEFKAPNGKESLLLSSLGEEKGREAWYAVRLENFKEWFGDWEALLKQEEFDALVDEAFDSDKEPKGKMLLRRATPGEIAEVKRQGGPDITGLEHEITSEHIRHIIKEHGGKNESIKHPDQRPITKDDISLLPAVIDAPTEITVKNIDKNLTSVIYGKDFGKGKICYVERIIETSEKNKPRLTLKTAWVKATTGAEPSTSAVYTPHRNSNILFPNGRVKPDSVSKVVDENGEPCPLWHQTSAEIEVFEPRREGAGKFDNEMPFGIFLKPHDQDIGLAGKNQISLLAKIINPLQIKNRVEMQQYLESNVEGYAELKKQYENIDEIHKKRLEEIEAEIDKQVEKWEEENPNNDIGTNEGLDKRTAAVDKIYDSSGMNTFFDEWHNAGNNLSTQMKELVNEHFLNSEFDGIILEQDQGSFGKKTTKTFVAFNTTQVKHATGNAGSYDPLQDNIYFQIIGELGAAALDRAEEATHRMDNLAVARQMEEAGKDAMEIRLATGWERGADGKWRYEIADISINETGRENLIQNGFDIKLKELINADELLKAYSELQDYPVFVIDAIGNIDGYFNTKEKYFAINFLSLQTNSAIKILTHEIQHAIQEIEGFAKGSSVRYWKRIQETPLWIGDRDKLIEKYTNEKDTIFESLSDEEKNIYREYNQRVININDNIEKGELGYLAGFEISNILGELKDEIEEKLKNNGFNTETFDNYVWASASARHYIKNNDKMDPFILYRRTAGEVEARNAEKRIEVKQANRRIFTLKDTEDVSRDDQIFIEEGIYFQTAAPTDTKEFKKWFGDSKVMDENGQPKIVFHNTSKRFNSFDLSEARQVVEIPGFFFTDTQGEYADFGDIEMQVYLSIKNPYKGNYEKYKGIKGGSSDTAFINIRNELIKDGYDGIITEEDEQPTEYIAFFPEQIKSVYNRGTWDPLQDNIYFQTGWHGSAAHFLRFDNRFMGAGVGAQAFGYGQYISAKKEVANSYRVKAVESGTGQLYKVEIPDNNELLNWDKELRSQKNILKLIREQAVKEDIDDILNYSGTGGEFYANELTKWLGNPKEVSAFLSRAGVKGNKHFDKRDDAYNFVIFNDSEVKITQTYYSEAFRDAGLSEFMVNYPDIIKEAARFESGAEMAEYYADYFAMPDEVYKKARALGYFDAIARAAKEGNAEGATNAISGVSADAAATALAAYGVDISIALETANLVRKDDWLAAVKLLEKNGVPSIDAEVYANTAKIFSKSEMSWLERATADEKIIKEDAYKKNKWKPEDGTFYVDAENKEPIKIGEENKAVTNFFNTLVDGAKEIYPDNENEALRAQLAGEERNAKSFVDMINTEKGFDDFITAAYAVHRDGRQRGETEEETRQNEVIFERAQAVFNTNNGNWKAAFENLAAGKKVNEHTKKIIRGMIRNRPLQYMEAYAMMTGDDTWLPQENDVRRIKRLDTEGLVDEEYLEKQSPEELERIGRRLSSDRIKKKIENKTLQIDDPDLEEYEKQLTEDMAKARKLIAEREEGFKEYRRYLELARNNARKQQILLEQEATDTSDAGLKASRERTKELSKAHQQVRNTINEMERFMREDLLQSQREAFMELQNQLRESERIHAELKAIGDIREIKKRNIRMLLRKPDLKTVSLHEAKYIEWIQAHFDSYEAVARFIGRGAKDIRKLYNEFATNAEYRADLKKKLLPTIYQQIERIVYKDVVSGEVRAYGTVDARQRKILYRHLLDHKAIFEELGIDILEEPRKFTNEEWYNLRMEMQDRIPADILYKMEGLLETDSQAEKDGRTGRRFKVENFTIEEIQTLAGVVSSLRKEGREREEARKEARSILRQEGREKIIKTIEEHMPKGAVSQHMKGIASTKIAEEKRSGVKSVWYALHNARRFFRRLEGGNDGFLYDFITQREYAAFDHENKNVFRRRKEVEKKLKEAKIDLKDLGKHTFTLYNGNTVTLDEMLTFYYAQFNERAIHAVIFGNFASQEERNAIKALADERDIIGQMNAETHIARRYHDDMKKLDYFFAQDGNGKYRDVMNIIGEDYDGNYDRLKEFVAREYNEELGSEPYYMPLMRQGVVAKENTDVEQAMADHGLSHYINKGFTKGRVDIPSFGQQAIQAGFYSMWDRMVVKQEHLMAYDPLHKELQQIFKGQDSETLRDTLRSGHSQAAIDYIEKFISELAAPPVQENLEALSKINRIIRGHYPAAVLGWRIASIVKQSIESPPPFFQYVAPWQYAAAGVTCLKQETRDMIREKSVYMKARYFDPAAAVVKEMERMYLTGKLGKAEAVLTKIESTGMKGQEWIDAVCVMPGWLAAYNKKFAELNNKESNLSAEEVEAKAVRYADQVVRDCQPSSVLMDQVPWLKGDKSSFARMFMQFQTPIASIFQQLFIDAPANFKQGHALQAVWTWGIYALLAIVIGAMQEDDDGDEFDPKKRGIDAVVMPISMIPIYGGDLSYAAESGLRNGKITTPRRSNFPVLDQGIKAINNISNEQWGKAANNVVNGFMFSVGLPVAAKQDIEKAIETGRPQRIIGIK